MNTENVIATRPDKRICRDGDKVIKLFGSSFSKSDILNEALNQTRIEETGLNIPKLVEVTKLDGQWAIISDYIEGETLSSLMAEHPSKYDEYLNLFVDLQRAIHAKRAPLLNNLRDKMHRKISMSGIDATTRYDLHTRLESMPRRNKVCHGDYCAENVIITADGTPFVIDWAHATQGNAAADAARTFLILSLRGETEKAERYIKLFCQKNDTARQYVEKWLPIVAASQSVKGKPEERELLLRWVDVVDYQ